jgi:hypothetical protein
VKTKVRALPRSDLLRLDLSGMNQSKNFNNAAIIWNIPTTAKRARRQHRMAK